MSLVIRRATPASLVALITAMVFIAASIVQGGLSVTGAGYGCGTYSYVYGSVYNSVSGAYDPVYHNGTYSGIYNNCPPSSGGGTVEDDPPAATPAVPATPADPSTGTPATPATPAEPPAFKGKLPTAGAKAIEVIAAKGKAAVTIPPGLLGTGAAGDVEIDAGEIEDKKKVEELAEKAKAVFTPAGSTASAPKARSIAPPFFLNVKSSGTSVKHFARPIKVKMQIPPTILRPRLVKVFWIDLEGRVRPLKTKVGSVIFDAPGSGTFVFMEIERDFSDVAGHWSAADLEIAAAQMIVDGYPDGTFKPEGAVTRAEFVAMMVRSMGLEASGNATFADVPADAWYSAALKVAVDQGLIKGVGDGRFDPNGIITREQMMAILGRAAKNAGLAQATLDLSAFADTNQVSAWAKDDVAAAVKAGLVQGVREGLTFKLLPSTQTTRAQSAVTLLRLYDKTE